MPGFKRDHQGIQKKPHHGGQKKPEGQQKTAAGSRNAYTPMFERFREELDEHHDRRERIVKASRDITALSKKIIFTLQRVRKIEQHLPSDIQKDMDSRLDQISQLLATLAPEVQGINRYRYSGNLSCMEELVEALTFAHYLKTQSLIPYGELVTSIEELGRRAAADVVPAQADANMTESTPPKQGKVAAADVPVVNVTEHDYLYGVFDLTGEMMRFATTSTALTRTLAGTDDSDVSTRPRTILQDMQEMRSFFEMLPQSRARPWNNKLDVLRGSVQKVEAIGYSMAVRGSEREEGWVPDAGAEVELDD